MLAAHLDLLAGIVPRTVQGRLEQWLDRPRTSAQEEAFAIYLEELSWFWIAEAVVLKTWSDRRIRPWARKDLENLNWALNSALRRLVPADRESWQITRQNLYSWYTPSTLIQDEAFSALESLDLADEGPALMDDLLIFARRHLPQFPESRRYDSRFHSALWKLLQKLAPPALPNRTRTAYTPTLRDGSALRHSPDDLLWFGTEMYSFHIMTAEFSALMKGPASPPFWALSSGLEIHSPDQMDLDFARPTSSVLQLISEREDYEFSVVVEESPIRISERSPASVRFKAIIDSLPFFKNRRSATTSLATLQAVAALGKLRPGGVLAWIREEPLGSVEGREALAALLDKGRLIGEWDFSSVEHALPAGNPLFPRFLYLLIRETDGTKRRDSRPRTVRVEGTVRSHVEVPLLLEDAFSSLELAASPRGHWRLLNHHHPRPQQDWPDHWPDPEYKSTHQRLDRLKSRSDLLGRVTLVRQIRGGTQAPAGSDAKLLRVAIGRDGEVSRLDVAPFRPEHADESGVSFALVLPHASWAPTLRAYLESDSVREWLDFHLQKKSGKWILDEASLRMVPVPHALLDALQNPPLEFDPDVIHSPSVTAEKVAGLPGGTTQTARRCAEIFTTAAPAFTDLLDRAVRVNSFVSPDGGIRWSELLKLLRQEDCVPLAEHPGIRKSGSLPAHIPIVRIDRVKMPSPGYLLTTEAGFFLHLSSDSPALMSILWDQIQGMRNVTWAEICAVIRLPAQAEVAQSTANDVLRSHAEQTRRKEMFSLLLKTCLERQIGV